jgi:hypothetical protein
MNDKLFKDVPVTAQIAFEKISIPQEDFIVSSEWFDWASELITAGYTNPDILALSERKEADNIEEEVQLLGLTNVVFDELDIDLKDTESIYRYYGIYIINMSREWEWELRDTLCYLAYLYTFTQSVIFYDFPFLHAAYVKLKEEGEQMIWTDMDWKNKDDYVRTYLRRWIRNPKSQCYELELRKSPMRRAIERIFCSSTAYIIYLVFIIALFFLLFWFLFKFADNIPTLIVILVSFVSTLLTGLFKIIEGTKKWWK